MFLSEWREFPSAPCLAGRKTWWQLASRCCRNRVRPWHASELVSSLVGLRTYQHPGYYTSPIATPVSHGLAWKWIQGFRADGLGHCTARKFVEWLYPQIFWLPMMNGAIRTIVSAMSKIDTLVRVCLTTDNKKRECVTDKVVTVHFMKAHGNNL